MSEPVYVPVADLPMRRDVPDAIGGPPADCDCIWKEPHSYYCDYDERYAAWESNRYARVIAENAELRRRIDGVSAIHRSDNFGFCVACSHDFGGENWPCATARALGVSE